MTALSMHKFLGLTLAMNLASQPLLAAYAPVGAVDSGASVPAGEGAVRTTAASSANDAFKATAISMNALPLPRTAISMDFQDADVRDVMHLMAVKSGINIIYGPDISGPVTVHLDRVPFDQAFQTVLTLKGLVALRVGPRIIRVVSSTNLTTEQSQAATFTKVFILKYTQAQDVKAPLDAIRSAASRKGVSTVDTKNNALIITDTVEGLKEVEELIPTLDRKPQQVDIEAKIVEVTLDEDTKLGITWAFARGNPGDINFYGTGTRPGNVVTGVGAAAAGGTVSPMLAGPVGLGADGTLLISSIRKRPICFRPS
jgi:type IV pilus assembly protein PilQ